MWWLAIAVARSGECTPVHVADLDALVVTAEKAYVDLDTDGFGRAADEAVLDLPCLADRVTVDFAGNYHRIATLWAFTNKDAVGTDAGLRAMRVVAPNYRFSDDLLPPDHELRKAHEAAPTAEGKVQRLTRPSEGQLLFDGSVSLERPLERATLYQRVDGAGAVVETTWLRPDAQFPEYAHPAVRKDHALAGAGALGLAAGALYGIALGSQAAFWADEPGFDRDGAKALRGRTNALTYSAIGVGGLAVGVGVYGLAFGG